MNKWSHRIHRKTLQLLHDSKVNKEKEKVYAQLEKQKEKECVEEGKRKEKALCDKGKEKKKKESAQFKFDNQE